MPRRRVETTVNVLFRIAGVASASVALATYSADALKIDSQTSATLVLLSVLCGVLGYVVWHGMQGSSWNDMSPWSRYLLGKKPMVGMRCVMLSMATFVLCDYAEAQKATTRIEANHAAILAVISATLALGTIWVADKGDCQSQQCNVFATD